MRKRKYAIMKTSIMLLLILSLVVVANAGYSTIDKEKQYIKTQRYESISPSYAQISFYLYEGEGCACQPVRFAPIVAQGLDTSHNATGETDHYGFVLLELEFDATYRITIETEIYQTVIVDFIVVDDQAFTFHLQLKNVSISSMPVLLKIIQNIQQAKKLIN